MGYAERNVAKWLCRAESAVSRAKRIKKRLDWWINKANDANYMAREWMDVVESQRTARQAQREK